MKSIIIGALCGAAVIGGWGVGLYAAATLFGPPGLMLYLLLTFGGALGAVVGDYDASRDL